MPDGPARRRSHHEDHDARPVPRRPTLAGSPSGAFLAAWTDGTGSAPVWASVLTPGPAGTKASPAVELTSTGTCPVAAATDAGFAVVWGVGSAVQMQSLDAQGAAIGSSTTVWSASAAMCPQALLSTAGGLVIATTTNQPVGGEDIVTESVARIDGTGTASTAIALDTIGPGVVGNVALADVGGQAYAAFVEWPDASADTAVAHIDWSTGSAMKQATVPGFFQSFVAAGGRLWLSTQGGSGYQLYTALPGASFQLVAQGCSAFEDLAVDACGQLVGMGAGAFNPGGFASGFYAQAFGGVGSQVSLGDVTEGTLAGAGSTFGVLWFARVGPGGWNDPDGGPPGTLSFATLSWK